MTQSTIEKNDRREIFGWTMYDWANSAFSTTVAGALLAPYLTALAQSAVGENGVVLGLGLGISNLVEDLFNRSASLGYIGLVFAVLAVVALIVIITREALSLARLETIEKLHARANAVLARYPDVIDASPEERAIPEVNLGVYAFEDRKSVV